ncbi:MAG: glycosyltransferase family 2 protein, partial [Bacteroidales bacterium]|nr:glycosyltransferase family 2 protein [Bacteroidales bacterium]
RRLGGLDDRFFAHMEEIDYCWRLQLEGYRVCCVPQSVVYHLGGGTLPQSSPWKLKLNFRNGLLLLENNLARTFAAQGERPKKALRHAGRVIFWRKCLDGCAAAVYLLSGRKDYFKAVLEAHREARKLVSRPDAEVLAGQKTTGGPAGRYGGSVILASLLKGKRVFDYIESKMVL